MSPAREVNIAMRARLYRLLADRDEYLMVASLDIEERIERTRYDRATCLSSVDAELIVDATEVDRACGVAVRVLTKGQSAGVVEMLTVLDRDRRAAIALALPEKRRKAVFGPGVESTFEIDVEMLRTAEEIGQGLDATAKIPWEVGSGEISVEFAEFDHQLRRRARGLPAEFTDAQLEAIDRPRGSVQEFQDFLVERRRALGKRVRQARSALKVVK